jgi:hypothetical protein
MHSKPKVLMAGTAVIALSLLYFFYPVSQHTFYPRCIFFMATGFNCPGCGSQRAFSSLLHGDIRMALGDNLLMVASIPFLLYAGIVAGWNSFSTRRMQQPVFYSAGFAKGVLVVVLLFWLLRNIPVYPFSLLKA